MNLGHTNKSLPRKETKEIDHLHEEYDLQFKIQRNEIERLNHQIKNHRIELSDLMDMIAKEESNKNKCFEIINDINIKHEQSIMSVDSNFSGGILGRDQILNKLNSVQQEIMEKSVINKAIVGKIYQIDMDSIYYKNKDDRYEYDELINTLQHTVSGLKKECELRNKSNQLLSQVESENNFKKDQAKTQSDEAINIFQCENITLSKLQNVKMEEISSLEEYKIEANRAIDHDTMV